MGSSLCCIKASPPSPNSHPPSVSLGHTHERSSIPSITLDEYLAQKNRHQSASRDLFGGRVYKRVVRKTITLDEFLEQLKNHPDAGKRPISPREVLVRYERLTMQSITLDEYLAQQKNRRKRPITPSEDVSGGHKYQSSLITNILTLIPKRKNRPAAIKSPPITPAEDVLGGHKHQSSLITNSLNPDESNVDEREGDVLDQCKTQKPKKTVSFSRPEVSS